MKIARDLGLDAYRISISWPRILPGDVLFNLTSVPSFVEIHIRIGFNSGGKIEEGVNQDGINYYNDLINELLSNGYFTIYPDIKISTLAM